MAKVSTKMSDNSESEPTAKPIIIHADEGKFANGLKHGQGVKTNFNGDKYIGRYANGKWHGQGVLIYVDGKKLSGQWHEGERHGAFEVTRADGTKDHLEYANGIRLEVAELTRTDSGSPFECSICYSTSEDGEVRFTKPIFSCGFHMFCSECTSDLVKRHQHMSGCCPTCRAPPLKRHRAN
jgi:hypothetical protein